MGGSAAWLGKLQAELHFPLPFQKSGPIQKGPRYVELVLVADNQEVKWGEMVPVGLLSHPALWSSKPPWKSLCVLPTVQEAQGPPHRAEPHEGNCEPRGQGETRALDLPSSSSVGTEEVAGRLAQVGWWSWSQSQGAAG